MPNPVDVALVRLAVSRGLLSPTDGQHMESLHQQGQGSAVQLLEGRGVAVQELQRSFGGTPFGCRACGFACAAHQLSHLTPDLRCPKCGQASLAPGRVPSARIPRSGSSLVRPATGAFSPAGVQATSGSHAPGGAPSTGAYASRPGTAAYGSGRQGTASFPPGQAQTAGYPLGESGVESSGGSHMPRAQKGIRPGSSIGGYLLGRELGRGACGHVFLARRQGLSRDFAVKVLRQDMLGNSEAVARFFREADLASKLSDPGVVSALDVGQDGQHCYYVMDFCPGQTLKQRMRERPFSVPEAVELVRELARIQKVAHQRGVVHRDFKPSNIMLAEPDGRPKVTDFGLARDTSSSGQTLSRTGDLIGTPIYMAPEQLMGERADVRADVYALGVILYELLCGKRPYEAPTTIELATLVLDGRPTPPRSINPSLDPQLEAIVMKALAKERQDRFQDGGDFEAALVDYLSAGATSVEGKRSRVSRRRSAVAPPSRGGPPLAALVGGGVLVLALGVGGALLYSSHQAEKERMRKLAALDRALVQAREDARLGDWDAVPQALGEARGLSTELEHEGDLGEVLRELGGTFLDGLDLGNTPRIAQAETRLTVLESWPGYAEVPELVERVGAARDLLRVRQSLSSVSREAANNVPYADLAEMLKTLKASAPVGLQPYVQLALADLALRRCQLRQAEFVTQELLRELRMPADVERGARLNLVISQLYLELHQDAQLTAEALRKRWPESREAELAACLALFSRGDVGAAQDRVRTVVDANPDWLLAKVYGACLIYFGEEGGHARDWLATVEAAQPDNVFLTYAQGLSSARERDANGAVRSFEQVMQRGDPPLLDPMIGLAGILIFAGQSEDVSQVLELAHRHYPDSPEPRFYSGLQKTFVGVMARMGSMWGAKVSLPEGVEPDALAEAGARDMREVKASSPEAYRRVVQRMPGRFREGIELVVDAPEGKVISTVTQAFMSGRLGGMGGGMGGGRRGR